MFFRSFPLLVELLEGLVLLYFYSFCILAQYLSCKSLRCFLSDFFVTTNLNIAFELRLTAIICHNFPLSTVFSLWQYRESVEWLFSDVTNCYKFLDLKKKLKLVSVVWAKYMLSALSAGTSFQRSLLFLINFFYITFALVTFYSMRAGNYVLCVKSSSCIKTS